MDESSTLPPDAAHVGNRLSEWADDDERVGAMMPDGPRSHGEACWSVLEPMGLVRRQPPGEAHDGPRDPAELDAALRRRLTVDSAPLWIMATLTQFLAMDGGPPEEFVAKARALADDLVELLGPEGDWRANGDYVVRRVRGEGHPPEPLSNAPEGARWSPGGTWVPVTVAPFDAAVVGRGAGHCVVIVRAEA
ncbi:hypothetical protein [Embleya sp. NPDC001921]